MVSKFVLAVGIFLVIVSSFSFAAHPTKMSLQGSVEGLIDGNLGVKVTDSNSCSSGVFFDQNFLGAIEQGSFNLLLGDNLDLNLNYNTDYYLCLSVNGEAVGGAQKFVGGQGQVHAKDVNASEFSSGGGGSTLSDVGIGTLFPANKLTVVGDVNILFTGINVLNRISGQIYSDTTFGPRSNRTKVVVHEFGHAFGGLADEYGDTGLNLQSGATPNCDDNSDGLACNKWSSITNSCTPVCEYTDWFRPFEESLMRFYHVDTNFMPVNEVELSKDLDRATDPTAFRNLGSNLWSYVINAGWDLQNVIVTEGTVTTSITSNNGSQYGNRSIKLYSDSGALIYDANIAIPLYLEEEPLASWFDGNGNQIVFDINESIIDLNMVDYAISVPYYTNAKTLEILDITGVSILTIDASKINPVEYSIGYGAGIISNPDYNVNYSLISQPVGKIIGADYNVTLKSSFVD